MNQRELFFLSVTIFLTILAWIMLDIYKVQINQTTTLDSSPAVNVQLNPKIFTILQNKEL